MSNTNEQELYAQTSGPIYDLVKKLQPEWVNEDGSPRPVPRTLIAKTLVDAAAFPIFNNKDKVLYRIEQLIAKGYLREESIRRTKANYSSSIGILVVNMDAEYPWEQDLKQQKGDAEKVKELYQFLIERSKEENGIIQIDQMKSYLQAFKNETGYEAADIKRWIGKLLKTKSKIIYDHYVDNTYKNKKPLIGRVKQFDKPVYVVYEVYDKDGNLDRVDLSSFSFDIFFEEIKDKGRYQSFYDSLRNQVQKTIDNRRKDLFKESKKDPSDPNSYNGSFDEQGRRELKQKYIEEDKQQIQYFSNLLDSVPTLINDASSKDLNKLMPHHEDFYQIADGSEKNSKGYPMMLNEVKKLIQSLLGHNIKIGPQMLRYSTYSSGVAAHYDLLEIKDITRAEAKKIIQAYPQYSNRAKIIEHNQTPQA